MHLDWRAVASVYFLRLDISFDFCLPGAR